MTDTKTWNEGPSRKTLVNAAFRLMNAKDLADLEKVEAETRERFGKGPNGPSDNSNLEDISGIIRIAKDRKAQTPEQYFEIIDAEIDAQFQDPKFKAKMDAMFKTMDTKEK